MEITPVPAAPPDPVRPRTTALDVPVFKPREGPVAPMPPATRQRLSGATLAGLAAAVGAAAIVLGSLAFVFGMRSHGASSTEPRLERAIALLTRPTTRLLSLGARGAVLAVDPQGRGYLVPRGFATLAEERTYELWASSASSAPPQPLALFRGVETVVPLTAPVARGMRVAVTTEPAGGSVRPSGAVILVSRLSR